MIRLLFHPFFLIAIVCLVMFTPLNKFTPMASWTAKMSSSCAKAVSILETSATDAETSLPAKIQIPPSVTSAISQLFSSAASFCASPQTVIPTNFTSGFNDNAPSTSDITPRRGA